MKSIVVLLMMVWVLPSSAQLFGESTAPSRFTHVNLKKLRKDVLNELLKDNLIPNRRSQIFLFLKEDGIEVNRLKLSKDLDNKYTSVLAAHELGRGPNRLVLINPDCIAVGDFWDESFSGKSEGRLSLQETREAMAALE